MGVGILPPFGDDHIQVPGTRALKEEVAPGADVSGDKFANLKRHPKHHDVILQPQPSDDPNDPLNWSRLRKEMLFISIMLCTSAVAVIGPIFIPAFSSMAAEFDRDLTAIANLNGILVMMLGITSFIGIALGRVFGKRPFLVFTMVLEIIGLACAAKSSGYWSLYGSRILQGLGIGGFACVGNALISDVFFLHEQGTRIALWQFAWVFSVNASPLVSSHIIATHGWRMAFWAALGYTTFCSVFYFLAAPETTYVRQEPISVATTPPETESEGKEIEMGVASAQPALEHGAGPQFPARKSPFSLWNGIMTDDSILLVLSRPFVVGLTPPIFWSLITYGIFFTGTIVTGATFSQIFAVAPYNLDTVSVGNISSIGPLLGSIIGFASSGPLADFAARTLARRNRGYFEPEMYLVLMLPAFVFCLAGFVGWGHSVANGAPRIVPAAMIAIAYLGSTFGFSGTIMYASVAFPARGGDAFGIMMLAKSAIAFGLLFVANTWLATVGPVAFYGAWAGLTCGTAFLALPLYIFGKRIRLWTSKNSMLGWTTR
ncbi:hypothetical protein L486_08243 [Kwoniella mangroviensis CBS 10435]|uniref:Major facilitator superfamily (MFS) profile domain-containing protein n=1 Tax=Kwoniella mangroviensis CBS 10435 TaxID=1331196 RepID=A0A1B9IFA3_9TREE|nr:hypothetical protein L486_08243 [Kwoniella mangroviensis CBS 10435]OCF74060.1 hypothetical protein I204_05910 [Kwoniella mangroviensis CBS 8886]